MIFNKVFIEEQVLDNPSTAGILKKLGSPDYVTIRKIEDYFGRFQKPYLEKRTNLNLYIGRKEGELVKEAPPAYGYGNAPHYYFIHSYNCIYECEYCYLQGYFSSPDIVLFVNYDEMVERMKAIVKNVEPGVPEVWFHAGEFSDSLALSNITGELEHYYHFLRETPLAKIELRTKSANIKSLLALTPLPNLIVSFTLNHEDATRLIEHKTASLNGRLKAMKTLASHGFRLAIHLDPLLADNAAEERYKLLSKQIFSELEPDALEYISLGIVRFSDDTWQAFQKNYPTSKILSNAFHTTPDGKRKIDRSLRRPLLKQVFSSLAEAGMPPEKIYFCMED
jgi:spore photoproduct lyase